MATVTVVTEWDGITLMKVVGVFSDEGQADKYLEIHDPKFMELDTDNFELDGLVDDENKPELRSNHPLRNK